MALEQEVKTAWTADRVLALAPDPASIKSGKSLANPNNWSGLGQSDRAIWGECKGSGKEPYRTQVDLSEPAFRCTCPSRKFPCKHGLGLLLIMVNEPKAIIEGASPDWVLAWLDSRAQREQKKETQTEKVTDPAAQAKRATARLNKVKSGVEDLQLWLKDLIRKGLASVQSESYSFWEQPAARMIDAQAPSLARQLREMAGIAGSGKGWEERLLLQLGKLQLVLSGFQRLESLPLELQADIRSQIGWTQTQTEVLANNGANNDGKVEGDIWIVMGQQIEMEERLRINRTWLWGIKTNRSALLLQFAHGTQPFETNFIVGDCVEAELAFFDGSYPLRAIIKSRDSDMSALSSSKDHNLGYETIDMAIAAYSNALGCNPWLERFPFLIQQVVPILIEENLFVSDRTSLIPISRRFERIWNLLALSGGHPVTIFGEWNGCDFLPLSIILNGRFYIT
jgi:hypothetical protein